MSAIQNSDLPTPTAEDRARARFQTATTGRPASDGERASVKKIIEAVVALATLIEERVPSGRNKSLALTALEDVHMRANRGVFQDGPWREDGAIR